MTTLAVLPVDIARLRWGGLECPAVAYIAGLALGSRSTQAQALRHAARLWGHVDAHGRGRPDWVPWDALTRSHLLALRSWAAETMAPATANRILCAVRMTLREAYRGGLLTRERLDLLTDLEPVRGDRLPPGRAVLGDELDRLFRSCRDDRSERRGARDACILAMLYGTGLRRAELVALELEDLREDGSVMVRRGKGNRERLVHLPAGTRRAVDRWLAFRGRAAGPLLCAYHDDDNGPELRAMATTHVYSRVRCRARTAGVSRFSPHDLRRSYIGDQLDRGTDLVTVQRAVGHLSPTTTSRYDRRAERAQREAAERLHVPV